MTTRFKTAEDIINAFESVGYDKKRDIDNVAMLSKCVDVDDERKEVTVTIHRHKSGSSVNINFPTLPTGETSSKKKEVFVEYLKTPNGLAATAVYSNEMKKKTFLEAFRIA